MAHPHNIDPAKLRMLRAECGDCGGELTDASLRTALAGATDLHHRGGDLVPCPEIEISKGRDGRPLSERHCTLIADHEGDCVWGFSARIARAA